MKEFLIRITRENDTQSFKLAIPSHDIALMELMPALYRLFDKIIAVETATYDRMSCHKGCNQCCRQLVPISIPEAFYLNTYFQSLSQKRQTRIGSKLAKVLKCTATAGTFVHYNRPENFRKLDQNYFDLKLNCPFLEYGACGIYPQRPLACREYYVASDAAKCLDPYQNEVEKVKIKRNMGALLAAFSGRLYGLPPLPIPLVLFRQWAGENQILVNVKRPGTWFFEKLAEGLISLNDPELEINYQAIP